VLVSRAILVLNARVPALSIDAAHERILARLAGGAGKLRGEGASVRRLASNAQRSLGALRVRRAALATVPQNAGSTVSAVRQVTLSALLADVERVDLADAGPLVADVLVTGAVLGFRTGPPALAVNPAGQRFLAGVVHRARQLIGQSAAERLLSPDAEGPLLALSVGGTSASAVTQEADGPVTTRSEISLRAFLPDVEGVDLADTGALVADVLVAGAVGGLLATPPALAVGAAGERIFAGIII